MTPNIYASSENSGTTKGSNNGAIHVSSSQGTNTIGSVNNGPMWISNK